MTTTHHAISVHGLSHRYAGGAQTATILNNVSLFIDSGEIVALIGRSGSGKSTLLNLMSGLEPIVDGDVSLMQQSMRALDDNDRTLLRGRSIGFIYQAFNLIPTLSVNDNISLPLALTGIPVKQHNKRLAALLDDVGLTGRGDDYPDRLSGGEQQRVAIARALAHEPQLILADEPTGNLDAASGRQVIELLSRLVRHQNSAMLLVTHSMEVASRADRVLHLDHSGITEISQDTLGENVAW